MANTHTQYELPTVDAAFEQVREAGQQYLEVARKSANLMLDSYEQAVQRTLSTVRTLID